MRGEEEVLLTAKLVTQLQAIAKAKARRASATDDDAD